jgi:RNA polymerase sigma factor (sigma-70 family)
MIGDTLSINSTTEFEVFYADTFQDVQAFVRRRTDPMLVEEVLSETYLVVWRRRADVPTEARAWLFTVARNQMLSVHKGARRHRELQVRLSAAPTEQYGEDASVGVLERLALRQAWNTLRPAEQEVLALSLFEELDAPEAAQVLGCTRAAYAMRLSRARRALGAALQAGIRSTVTPAAAAVTTTH